MKREKADSIVRSICVSVAVVVGASMLLLGCSRQKEETTTTASQTEYTTTTTSETELTTTTEETEPTTSETLPMPTSKPVSLDAFLNITEEYTLDDIINEIGPYGRIECKNAYVWTLDDGSEVWVFDIKAEETINKADERVLAREGIAIAHINGLEETLLFSSAGDVTVGKTAQLDKYSVSLFESREFGPELEAGHYLLEENGITYVIVSLGRQETRGQYIRISEINLKKADIAHPGLMILCETETADKDLPDIGRPPYPCDIVGFDQLPDNYAVVNEYRVEIPFMGYIKDSVSWEVIPPEDS